ncbi:hypothetical protein CLF_111436 [Clonorchis sinensis]|uniref:Uncharacterized protein n=1 Tax=Clonorchis sinensis TaxID=79923 RepID=G7YUV8_CLOSI|nr:hypothetical protein CLF_111436 [Clonorchis sinensis]
MIVIFSCATKNTPLQPATNPDYCFHSTDDSDARRLASVPMTQRPTYVELASLTSLADDKGQAVNATSNLKVLRWIRSAVWRKAVKSTDRLAITVDLVVDDYCDNLTRTKTPKLPASSSTPLKTTRTILDLDITHDLYGQIHKPDKSVLENPTYSELAKPMADDVEGHANMRGNRLLANKSHELRPVEEMLARFKAKSSSKTRPFIYNWTIRDYFIESELKHCQFYCRGTKIWGQNRIKLSPKEFKVWVSEYALLFRLSGKFFTDTVDTVSTVHCRHGKQSEHKYEIFVSYNRILDRMPASPYFLCSECRGLLLASEEAHVAVMRSFASNTGMRMHQRSSVAAADISYASMRSSSPSSTQQNGPINLATVVYALSIKELVRFLVRIAGLLARDFCIETKSCSYRTPRLSIGFQTVGKKEVTLCDRNMDFVLTWTKPDQTAVVLCTVCHWEKRYAYQLRLILPFLVGFCGPHRICGVVAHDAKEYRHFLAACCHKHRMTAFHINHQRILVTVLNKSIQQPALCGCYPKLSCLTAQS